MTSPKSAGELIGTFMRIPQKYMIAYILFQIFFKIKEYIGTHIFYDFREEEMKIYPPEYIFISD